MIKNKIVAIIQARTGSTRLPNKVLADIEGKPMLWHIINRLKSCKKLDDIILAIPAAKTDDILENFARKNQIKYFRGSEKNVLSRYYFTAKKFKADAIVRICSDCPLVDCAIVDKVVDEYLKSGSDYTSNTLKKTFPLGLAVEVFNFKSLKKSHLSAKKPYQREHVTPYIYENPDYFKLRNVKAGKEIRYPDFRLTVDTKEDLSLIRKIYRHLCRSGKIFFLQDVVNLLKIKPQFLKINSNIKQNKLK
jgi:spore coat polysaccharide biosynthesis protein SpsF